MWISLLENNVIVGTVLVIGSRIAGVYSKRSELMGAYVTETWSEASVKFSQLGLTFQDLV